MTSLSLGVFLIPQSPEIANHYRWEGHRAWVVQFCLVVSNSFEAPWIVAHQAPLSMGFSRQEYWSQLPFSSPGDLPDPGIEPASPVAPTLQVESLPLSHLGNSAAAAAKSLQLCLTLCNPIDGSPPGSPVPGILQARTLEWVAISFSSA